MTARTEIRAGGLPVKKYYFLTKGLQSAARIICAPPAHKFHTCSLRSIFFAAHVAEENDWTFFAPAGANSTRFFDKLERARVLPAYALHLSRRQKKPAAAMPQLACLLFMCAARTVCPCAQRFFLLPKMPLRGSLTASFIDSA